MKTENGISYVILSIMIALVSCSKSSDTNQSVSKSILNTITAYAETEAGTKVVFGDKGIDGYQLLWENDDHIVVSYGTSFDESSYYSLLGGGSSSGVFHLDDGETAPSSGPYMALYPSNLFYQSSADSSFTISYPESIPLKTNGIASGYYPMISVSDSSPFYFKNCFGILELSLFSSLDAGVSSITVTSPTEKLSGVARLSYNSGSPQVNFLSGSSKIVLSADLIELSADSSKPTTLMIPLPPKSEGYDIYITIKGKIAGEDFESTVLASKEKTSIYRGGITKMPTLQFDAMVGVSQKTINIFTEVYPDSILCENYLKTKVGESISKAGICWSLTNKYPTKKDNIILLDNIESENQIHITGLSENTTYYMRSFAQKGGVTYYSSDVQPVTTPKSGLEYIENGALLGCGVEISGIVWAPVNCGVVSTDGKIYKYGKVYQWGRKQGQGLPTETIDKPFPSVGSEDDFSYVDENQVTVYVKNAVSTAPANNVFYSPISLLGDWRTLDTLVVPQLTAWEKTTNNRIGDPCPDGWRIPTQEEWDKMDTFCIGSSNPYYYDGDKGVYCVKDGSLYKDFNTTDRCFIFLPYTGTASLAMMWPSSSFRHISANQDGIGSYWSSFSMMDKWQDGHTYHVSRVYEPYDGVMSRYTVCPYAQACPIRCVKEN